MNREQLEKQKDETIKAKEREIQRMEEITKLHLKNEELLKQQIEDAKKNNMSIEEIKKLKDDMGSQVIERLKAQTDIQMNKENLTKIKNAHELLTAQKSGKGWDKIAGQSQIKEQLNDWFINKLALEQGKEKITMPNSVLFYGPKSTGKTYFAEAFAEQSGCHFAAIDMLQDNEDILIDLKTEAKKAKVITMSKKIK